MKTWLIPASLFLTCTILVTARRTYEIPPHIKAARDECLEELGFTEEEFHEGRMSGKYDEKDCFHACIDKKLGVIDDEGNINKEEAAKNFPPHIPKEDVSRVVDACYEQKGADDCETAVLYRKCVKKLIPRPPMPAAIKKIHDDCKDKLSLTDDDIDKLSEMRGQIKEDCFLACMGQGLGIFTETGNLDKKTLIEKSIHVSKEDAQKIIDECGNKQGANECETVVLLYNCLKKKAAPVFHQSAGPPSLPQD